MKKLKASSIYYALFLSIVIAIVLGSMVLFSGMNRQLATRFDVEEIVRDNAISGIEYAQANFEELPNNEKVDLRLFGEGIDSVSITKKQWGAFTILESTANHKNISNTKIALTGQRNTIDEPNLFVADQGRPIALCGDTRIEGTAFLPQSGLKRAYIEGKNYTGSQLFYGTNLPSERNLPPINEKFIEQLNQVSGELLPWDKEADSIHVSFAEAAQHFISDDIISLQNMMITGQIMIEAKDSIYVAANTNLKNIILKSKVIYIEKGFSGTLQIFASEKIILEEEVVLLYPSVLGLVEEEFPKEANAEITLGERSQVIGSVFLYSKDENFRLPVQLNIAKEAAIDGFVYCRGKTQHRGIVNGHLYTDKFYLKTASSTYENHLLDAQILNRLPEDFIYINLLKSTTKLSRIEWLD